MQLLHRYNRDAIQPHFGGLHYCILFAPQTYTNEAAPEKTAASQANLFREPSGIVATHNSLPVKERNCYNLFTV